MRKRKPTPELLRKACLEVSRHGTCSMECDVDGARIGWCPEVWERAKGGGDGANR